MAGSRRSGESESCEKTKAREYTRGVDRVYRYASPAIVIFLSFLGVCCVALDYSCVTHLAHPHYVISDGAGNEDGGYVVWGEADPPSSRVATVKEANVISTEFALVSLGVTWAWTASFLLVVNKKIQIANGSLRAYNWLGNLVCEGPLSEAWILTGPGSYFANHTYVFLKSESFEFSTRLKWGQELRSILASNGLKPDDPRATLPPLTSTRTHDFRRGVVFLSPAILLGCAIIFAYPCWEVSAGSPSGRLQFLLWFSGITGLLAGLTFCGYNRRIELGPKQLAVYDWLGQEKTRIDLADLQTVDVVEKDGEMTCCEVITKDGRSFRFKLTIGDFPEIVARLKAACSQAVASS